jgi:uncharacterized protein (TIGR00725 family)
MNKKLQIAVIGPAGPEEYKYKKPGPKVYKAAGTIGKLLAQKGCIVFCGGKSGIMESVAKGAISKNGTTVGVVRGNLRNVSNKYINVEIVTNSETGGDTPPLILSSDGVIILGGGAGTLQEMIVAYRNKIPMVALTNFDGYGKKFAGKFLDERKSIKIEKAKTPKEAVELLLAIIDNRREEKL